MATGSTRKFLKGPALQRAAVANCLAEILGNATEIVRARMMKPVRTSCAYAFADCAPCCGSWKRWPLASLTPGRRPRWRCPAAWEKCATATRRCKPPARSFCKPALHRLMRLRRPPLRRRWNRALSCLPGHDYRPHGAELMRFCGDLESPPKRVSTGVSPLRKAAELAALAGFQSVQRGA